MNPDNLIRMANKIGIFFESMPDQEDAALGLANHLKSYWEPRMRTEILNLLDQGRGPEIHYLIHKAASEYREIIDPKK